MSSAGGLNKSFEAPETDRIHDQFPKIDEVENQQNVPRHKEAVALPTFEIQ